MAKYPAVLALAAAVLFGLSTPIAKLVLDSVDPWIAAGLLYLGAGVGLAVLRAIGAGRRREAGLTRSDLPWLAGAIAAGGLVAPVLLMFGLAATAGSAASLLLTLESVATALIAWFLFREPMNTRVAVGMATIFAGAIVLAFQSGVVVDDLFGPLAIAGACVAWGIDNNLTRKVSLADPVLIAMLKGLVAGPVNLALGFAVGASLPAFGVVAVAGITGFLGYGVSLVLFVLALRHLGAARTGAYFATAPFVGALVALPLLGEPLTATLAIGGVLMVVGVWLHLTERHAHEHFHDATEHAHRHVHDEHHQHVHGPNDPPGEPHSHVHAHATLRHAHAHMPDAHHRHRH